MTLEVPHNPNFDAQARKDALFLHKLGSAAVGERTLALASEWALARTSFEGRKATYLTGLALAITEQEAKAPLVLLRDVAAKALTQPAGIGLPSLRTVRTGATYRYTSGDAIRRLIELQVLEVVDPAQRVPSFRPTQLSIMTLIEGDDPLGVTLRATEFDETFNLDSLRPLITRPEVLDMVPLA